jgi:uncharacterized protein (TIGR02171 family)
MALIRAAHRTFTQGASAQPAGADELPAFKNSFTYDFYLDTIEVTQGAYADLMGSAPATAAFGSGRDYPVYGVTWFDAALFANARSKASGLDTVYAYGAAKRSPSGSVYELSGLEVHLERPGYRLPTESEWEYAARAGSSTAFPWGEAKDSVSVSRFAWYSANAGGTTHPAGTLAANAFGLHDMAGNVMEWVGDWKEKYPSMPVSDFIGARDPGPEGEIPVKGGAFKYGLRELRPANRSATYATIPSASTEYVGFRCALGAIVKPAFSTADGQPIATGKVVLNAQRPQDLVGGYSAKMVFVNASPTTRHLAYVDYSKSPPKMLEFTDRDDVFHPAISPDGRWAAFGTRSEGVDSGSDLYVRALDGTRSPSRRIGPGFIPRWWVDPVTSDTFLVYANSAVDDLDPRWNAAETYLQKISGGVPQGDPRLLAGNGGYHDGYSADGRYLATGYRQLRIENLATGQSRILFTSPRNGKAAGDTSQVCNVSIAPDTTGRTLFLDFGYEGISALTHGFYGIHQVAFMADPAGNVLRWYKSPPRESGFEDLEWTNDPGFAVSGATDANQQRRRLYLLNLKDSTTLLLATGERIMQPAFWLGSARDVHADSGFSADSLGAYDDPSTSATREVFAVKMHLFWESYDRLEAAFVGSSQIADGLDPSEVTCIKGFNLAYGGGDLKGAEFVLRHYVMPRCARLRLVAISIPLGWLNAHDNDVSWSGTVQGSKGLVYDENHGFWPLVLPQVFRPMAVSAPYPSLPIDSLGLYPFPSHSWGTNLPEWAGPQWDVTDTVYSNNFAVLEHLVSDLSQRDVQVAFVVFPQSPAYKGMNSFSFWGPSWDTARGILAQLSALHAKYPRFHLIDLNQNGNHGFADSDAFDDMHLSGSGAKKAGALLNLEFQKILAP